MRFPFIGMQYERHSSYFILTKKKGVRYNKQNSMKYGEIFKLNDKQIIILFTA